MTTTAFVALNIGVEHTTSDACPGNKGKPVAWKKNGLIRFNLRVFEQAGP
jgi:hypothetical protein